MKKWLALISLGTIWGSSYLFIKIGGSQIPPITFVAGRVTVAGAAILAILLLRESRRFRHLTPQDWRTAQAEALLILQRFRRSSEGRTNQGPSSKVGGAEIPPVTFVVGRVGVAAIAVAVILLARREGFPKERRGVWLPLVVMGITNGVIPYTLITWGETEISSGLAGILVATMPIFTVLSAHWLTHDEKLNANKLAGIGLGFLGVVVLFIPDLRQGITLSLLGAVAVVVAAVSYAFATVFAHKYVRGVSNLGAEFGQLASAAAILLPVSLLHDQPWRLTPSLPALASLATLALLGTAFAYLLYYWLIEHAGPTSTSLVTYISPVSAILLGALILHEHFDWTAFAGLLAIIAGVGLVTRKPAQTIPVPVGAEAE